MPRAPKAQLIEAETEDAPKQTIGAAITDVLTQHDALTTSAIAEAVVAVGKDVNNRAISSAGGEWSLKKSCSKRGG